VEVEAPEAGLRERVVPIDPRVGVAVDAGHVQSTTIVEGNTSVVRYSLGELQVSVITRTPWSQWVQDAVVFPADHDDANRNLSRRVSVVTKTINKFMSGTNQMLFRRARADRAGATTRPRDINFFVGGAWLLGRDTSIQQYNAFLTAVEVGLYPQGVPGTVDVVAGEVEDAGVAGTLTSADGPEVVCVCSNKAKI